MAKSCDLDIPVDYVRIAVDAARKEPFRFSKGHALPMYAWKEVAPGQVVNLQPPMGPGIPWLVVGYHYDVVPHPDGLGGSRTYVVLTLLGPGMRLEYITC